MAKNRLRAIPLGGAGEVGRNMWVLEQNDEILVLDCGVMFPEADMLGVDLVLPDITYLRDQKDKIKAIVLTHGHEDHIGAVPYLVPELDFPPIYGTPLTLGMLSGKLKEHRLLDRARLVKMQAGESFTVGSFTIEPFSVAHSIPDTVGLAIDTPVGLAIYLTDWKFDHTPVDGRPTDLVKLSELGRRSPLLLITDCVRVESKGYTPSEQVVGEAFDSIFATAPGRIIVATFRIEHIACAAGDRLGGGVWAQGGCCGAQHGEYDAHRARTRISARAAGHIDPPAGSGRSRRRSGGGHLHRQSG
jgi:ribonuclease J